MSQLRSLWRRGALFVPAILFATACLAQAEPVRVATLYSSYQGGNKAFLNEYDKHLEALGWKAQKFENVDLAKLAAALPATDLVIGCSVYNLEHPQDFAAIREPFLSWLEQGGVALFTDASYDAGLGRGVCRWGERFLLKSATAGAHTKPSPETRLIRPVEGCPLAAVPNDLAPLATEHGHWAHFASCAPEWRPALMDSDVKPILVCQQVGKGLLAVTNLGVMNRTSAQQLGPALLENLWTYARCAAEGVELEQAALGPPAVGKHVCRLKLADRVDKEFPVHVRMTVKSPDGKVDETQANAALKPGAAAELDLPYGIVLRGRHEVVLALTKGEAQQPFWTMRRILDVPPWIAVSMADRWFPPDRTVARASIALSPDEGVGLDEAEMTYQIVSNGKALARKAIAPPEKVQEVTLPTIGVPIGPARFEVIVRRKGAECAGAAVDIFLLPPPRVWIKKNRQCIVEGKSFFPMGMYFVCWTLTKEQVLEGLRDLAQRGFNTAHVGTRKDWDFKEIADEAQRLGMKLIVEFGTPREETVAQWKDHPAILAWNPGDEPDGNGTAPEVMQSRREAFKALDPDHPSYLTLCVPNTYAKYARLTDVLTIDPYPVRQSSAELRRVAESVDLAQEAMEREKPLWVVPQAFGYEDKPGSWRVPTPAEERCMTYQALVHGARGLIYYTYLDRDFDLTKSPALREELTRLASEVRTLAPVLMAPGDGVLSRTGTGDCIHVLGKKQEGRDWVIAVNVSPEAAKGVSIPIGSQGKDSEVEMPFENRRLHAEGGVAKDDFDGHGVHVYVTAERKGGAP